jgi:hypothetical protein
VRAFERSEQHAVGINVAFNAKQAHWSCAKPAVDDLRGVNVKGLGHNYYYDIYFSGVNRFQKYISYYF